MAEKKKKNPLALDIVRGADWVTIICKNFGVTFRALLNSVKVYAIVFVSR